MLTQFCKILLDSLICQNLTLRAQKLPLLKAHPVIEIVVDLPLVLGQGLLTEEEIVTENETGTETGMAIVIGTEKETEIGIDTTETAIETETEIGIGTATGTGIETGTEAEMQGETEIAAQPAAGPLLPPPLHRLPLDLEVSRKCMAFMMGR